MDRGPDQDRRHQGDGPATVAIRPPVRVVPPPPNWMRTFLVWLGKYGNARYAADRAGVTWKRAYRERGRNQRFRKRWRRALRRSHANLEAEAIRRALDGTRETVTELYPDGGKKTTIRNRKSDRMLLSTLAAVMPEKWGKRSTLTVEQGGPAVDAEAQRAMLADPVMRELAAAMDRRRAEIEAAGRVAALPAAIDVTPAGPEG